MNLVTMARRIFLGLWAPLVCVLPSVGMSETCHCEQHDASSTSTSSSCTVAENSSQCSITHGGSASRLFNFDKDRVPLVEELEELVEDRFGDRLFLPQIPFREGLQITAMSGENALGDTILLEMWIAAANADDLQGQTEFTDLVRDQFEFGDRQQIQIEIALELFENGCWVLSNGFSQMTYRVDVGEREVPNFSCR